MVVAAPAGSVLAGRARVAGMAVFTGVRFQKTNRPIPFCQDILTLGRLVGSERFDLLHTHGSQDTWAVALAHSLFRLPQPILMTRHNTKPVRFHLPNRWLYRCGINHLVVVSRGALENYRQFFDAGILHEKQVSVIHSCVEVEKFAGPLYPERIRTELGISGEAFLVGLVGRVSRDKGHLVLLEAVPEILRELPNAIFIFVGRAGPKMERLLREIIQSRGLERSVRLLGFREDIPDITAALDVSVLPALGTDSSPAVLKEALFLGKPVVASRIGGIPEIVPEEEGILVPPGDPAHLAQAIITVLRRKREHITKPAALRLQEQFTPSFLCSSYLRVYEEVLRGCPTTIHP